MASARSAGSKVEFMGKEDVIEELTENSFDKDIDFFSLPIVFSSNVIISERLKNAIEAERLTGWDFIHADGIVAL